MGNRDNVFADKRTDGVSVVIPTYGRPDYLGRLLQSITKQTKAVDEVIVVDDFSPNVKEYQDIIKRYSSVLNIVFFRMEKNVGAPACRNKGINNCKYRYIALTDDDDEWDPQKNELEYEVINSQNIGLVYSHGIAIDDNGTELYQFQGNGRGNDIKALLRKCFIPSSSVMVTYEAIKEAGYFDVKMPSCQDWDMWVRIIAKGYSYDVVEKPLLIYHKHKGDSIGKSPKAAKGYKLYYKKHILKYVKEFMFTKEYKICLHAIKTAIL